MKFCDKGGNFDRVERDVELGSLKNYRVAVGLCEDLFGRPVGTVDKKYIVYVLGSKGHDADSTVSLYKIVGDKRVFLEVEGRSDRVVFYWLKKIAGRLPHKLTRINKSLYELFVKKG